MIRTVFFAFACLLFVGVLAAQEKKPEGKADAVKKASPDAVKKEGQQPIKKEAPGEQKKQLKEGVKKEGVKPEGGSQKGRLTKIGVESGVVKLVLDGKEYEFPVTDNTFAVLKTMERDGKQVVVGLQLMNVNEGAKPAGDKKELVKKEGQKNPGEKQIQKPKE